MIPLFFSFCLSPEVIRTHWLLKSQLDLATKKRDNVTYCHLSAGRGIGQTQSSVSLSFINRKASQVETGKLDNPFGNLIRIFPDLFYEVLGSCNGLALIGYSYLTLLWNPLIRECGKLVTKHSLLHNIPERYISGLDYDSSAEEYKAVVLKMIKEDIFDSLNKGVPHMFVCSTTTTDQDGYWKKVVVTVFMNGAPHWVVRPPRRSLQWCSTIIYFDMVEEKFKKLPTPPPQSSNQKLTSIVVLGGCLCAILYNLYGGRRGDFDVWALKEYGVKESWTKLFEIQMSLRPLSVIPLNFTKHGDEVFLLIDGAAMELGYGFPMGSKLLVAYNLKTKEETLVSTNIKSGAAYVESLVSSKCSWEKTGVPTY